MVRILRGAQRESRVAHGRGSAGPGYLLVTFRRRCTAASRQLAPFSARDVQAARFLLDEDCVGSLEGALRTLDAVFAERIRGASFFECLAGHYAFGDRAGRGPRAASKLELRRFAALFAQGKRGAA